MIGLWHEMSENHRATTSWKIHSKNGPTKVPLYNPKDYLITRCDKNESAIYVTKELKNKTKMDCCCAIPSKCVTHCSSVVSNKQQQTGSRKHTPRSPLILVLYTGGTIGMQPNDNDGKTYTHTVKTTIKLSSVF